MCVTINFSLIYFYWVMNMSFDKMIIGKRIKNAREHKGYTQEKLAEFLDVSNAYISKIERGKTTVNLNTLSTICSILEVSPIFILIGTSSSSSDYMRNEITDMIKDCSAEKIKLIANVISQLLNIKKSRSS